MYLHLLGKLPLATKAFKCVLFIQIKNRDYRTYFSSDALFAVHFFDAVRGEEWEEARRKSGFVPKVEFVYQALFWLRDSAVEAFRRRTGLNIAHYRIPRTFPNRRKHAIALIRPCIASAGHSMAWDTGKPLECEGTYGHIKPLLNNSKYYNLAYT